MSELVHLHSETSKKIFDAQVFLLATTACHFSTSELQKVVRTPQFFDILT